MRVVHCLQVANMLNDTQFVDGFLVENVQRLGKAYDTLTGMQLLNCYTGWLWCAAIRFVLLAVHQ